jgi:hypothetical protein
MAAHLASARQSACFCMRHRSAEMGGQPRGRRRTDRRTDRRHRSGGMTAVWFRRRLRRPQRANNAGSVCARISCVGVASKSRGQADDRHARVGLDRDLVAAAGGVHDAAPGCGCRGWVAAIPVSPLLSTIWLKNDAPPVSARKPDPHSDSAQRGASRGPRAGRLLPQRARCARSKSTPRRCLRPLSPRCTVWVGGGSPAVTDRPADPTDDRPDPSTFGLLVDDLSETRARALAAGATEMASPRRPGDAPLFSRQGPERQLGMALPRWSPPAGPRVSG